jgi:hypothetical protein
MHRCSDIPRIQRAAIISGERSAIVFTLARWVRRTIVRFHEDGTA